MVKFFKKRVLEELIVAKIFKCSDLYITQDKISNKDYLFKSTSNTYIYMCTIKFSIIIKTLRVNN